MDHISEARHIVIVGAGFGGISAALTLAASPALRERGYDIILIDRHHHHLYTPSLYEIAAIPEEYFGNQSLTASILISLRDIVRTKHIRIVCDEIIGRDESARTVILRRGGALPYAYLVLAIGAETNYFNIPGLQAHSVPLKTCDDAIFLRGRIETIFKKKPSLAIVVGGGGASGVEVAAELVNFVCLIREKIMPDRGVCDVSFVIAEASPDILPGVNPWIVRRARRRLERLGVAVKTGTAITSRDPDGITFADGSRLPCDILIWTGGVKGPAVLAGLNLPLSPKGTVMMDATLRAKGGDGKIFAVGDSAWFLHPETKRPLPWNVPVAQSEGRHVGREILRAMRGASPRPFRPRRQYPFILAVGRKYALADLVYVRFGGFAGWCAKQLVQLRYFLFILPWPHAIRLWWQNLSVYRSND
jgi:NADH dehydrogenase